MKWYPNLVLAAAQALADIFDEGYYADKVIERTLKSDPRWGSRDRAFIAESVYEVVRWYRRLDVLAQPQPDNLNAYQRLIGVHYLLQGETLPDWPVFQGLAETVERNRPASPSYALVASIPDWLEELGQAELGDLWRPTMDALNQPAKLVVRANTLKVTRQQLKDKLAEAEIATTELGDDALVLHTRKNLYNSPPFKEGWMEIQDYSSQQVAPFLDVAPGMRVIDACAGAGGKTLHLAALMHNKGRIIALDTEAWKLDELKRRARRAGVGITEIRPIANNKVIKRLAASADRVLIDAPCSGLGVLRRNPDAKWKLTEEFIGNLRQTQQKILHSYSQMVKPGGKLVYATCSILPSENEAQVEAFLQQHADEYRLLDSQHILPQDEGFDGFYMASLERLK
ncbi:MAG: RNA methyltransferase [Saprospiraceae bacterium]|jgi:16S rRNA (cytosine967-C5)-methyltransferase|nr:RNA methyltransferase [Saprospiraceae bacterium]